MRLLPLLLLLFIVHCSPISRSSLEKPKLQNGFEYYAASVDSMNSGAFTFALELVKDAIKLNPNYAKFYLLEGDVYYKLGNPEEALNSYTHATQLRSSSVEAYLRIAKIYENEYKNYDEAIKYYRRSYAVNNSIHNILIDIGECYLSKNEINLARHKAEEYKKLIEAENKLLSFDYFYLNGKISYMQHDFDSAKLDFEQAVKIRPKHFDAKLLLVKCLFELDNQEAGLGHINELMKLNDTVGEIYYFRALYYFTKNKFNDALGLFEQALSLDESLLKSHYYLGKIYESLGDKEKSLEHLHLYRQTMQIK
jgi:tetratricopeptide (TPR) repeat protein